MLMSMPLPRASRPFPCDWASPRHCLATYYPRGRGFLAVPHAVATPPVHPGPPVPFIRGRVWRPANSTRSYINRRGDQKLCNHCSWTAVTTGLLWPLLLPSSSPQPTFARYWANVCDVGPISTKRWPSDVSLTFGLSSWHWVYDTETLKTSISSCTGNQHCICVVLL